jgi:uncharacterized membrane protein YiaA
MNRPRSKRFLIDAIDERLGDVEKEKKFDLIMVFVGLAMAVVGVLLLSVGITNSTWAALEIIMVMVGVALCYVMTKEYIDDCKKAKRQNNNQ